MSRAICFDLTHLIARLGTRAPTGIDKVDLAYARHFSTRGAGPCVHYGILHPHTIAADGARRIVRSAEAAVWEEADAARDPVFARVVARLTGSPPQEGCSGHGGRAGADGLRRFARKLHSRVRNDGPGVPRGAVYLNVAQYGLELPYFFRWLDQRDDLLPVFFIHDLLPLDYPEYFRPGYEALFNRRLSTAFAHARAFIVTTEAVADRLRRERVRRGLVDRPVHVAPLPSSLATPEPLPAVDRALAAVPYFVVVGTIEPRKNHLLPLSVWRQLAREKEPAIPKLVIAGGRGWENEQIVDVLDRGLYTREHVIEVSGLASTSLARLIAHARALLMPSFAEGYGLPLVEALSLGTPVIATDAPVMREVTQGCATFLGPLDGLGWRDAVMRLAAGGEAQQLARQQAERFRAPAWPDYFTGIEGFLQSL